jgi:tetratricopeptide (TPR) repeat protein
MWRKIADLYKAEELSPAILGTVGDYLASKNDPKAEAYFTYLTEHGRSSDYADFGFAGLADIRLSQGKAKEALAICEEAIANNITMSKEKDLRFCKARALLELGKFDEAKKEFKEIAEIKEWRGETTAGCLFHLGLIEERQNRFNEAVVLYQRCIVAWKKYERWTAKAYLRSGILLGEKLGQKDAARQTFNEMITKDRIKDTPEAQEARKRLTSF